MNRSKKRIIAVLAVAVILGAIFSCQQILSSEDDENNVIEIPDYTVKLNTDVNYQCIDVKEITANFEEGNVTSLDVKIGLLPGSDTFNFSDLLVHLRYVDIFGEFHYNAYMLNGSEINPDLKDMNVMDVVDLGEVWDRTLITPNSTITFRIKGNFGPSPTGSLEFNSRVSMPIHMEIKMPPFITFPPLYTKFGGMILLNITDSLDYSKPASDDWLIDEPIFLKDQEIILDRNLIVVGVGTLSLENVTMKVGGMNNTKYGIYIGEGAELVAINSSISSTDFSDRDSLLYNINVFGIIYLENCNISQSQGLNVYGGSASIENCSFHKSSLNFSYANTNIANNKFSSCNGIRFKYGSCVIKDNIFDNMNRNIFGYGENFHFQDNLMDNCKNNIYVTYKTSTIIGNKFSNCRYGISVNSGLVQIVNNEMLNVEELGIVIYKGTGIIKNNTLIDSAGIHITIYGKKGNFSGFDMIIENNSPCISIFSVTRSEL